MTIDAQEIDKFNALANTWWDPFGQSRLLHQLNPYRLRWITEQINLENQIVLDVGCGGGILTEVLALKGAHVTGIDAASEVIQVAKQHAEDAKLIIQYEHITVEEFAKTHAQSFDVITCMELLEHVPDPEAFLKILATLLKPGGKILLSTINRNPKAYLLAVVMTEYVLRWLPKGTHDYEKFIQPSELAGYLRAAGFSDIQTCGLHYHPLKKEFSLRSRDLSVNYFMSACLA